MRIGNLDNEVYFKKVFTNIEVFEAFVKDILGIEVHVDKIETEKVLVRKTSSIKFKMDIFAESIDHRVIIEIQKVDYDYSYDRFIHYFISNLIDQQSSSKNYKFAKEVYVIVVITAPYKISEISGQPILDDVLLTTLNPQTLNGQVREMYKHKLVFLNPNFQSEETPPEISDWLDLIQESIKNPENPQVNTNKPAIRKAMELAEMDMIDPEELYEAKNEEARRETLAVIKKMGFDEGKMEGIEQGIEQGVEQGIEQRNIELIIDGYKEGFSLVQLAKLSKLNIEEIQAIIEKYA